MLICPKARLSILVSICLFVFMSVQLRIRFSLSVCLLHRAEKILGKKKTEHQNFEKYARPDGQTGVRKDEQTGGNMDGHKRDIYKDNQTTERCKDAFAPFSRKKKNYFGLARKIS